MRSFSVMPSGVAVLRLILLLSEGYLKLDGEVYTVIGVMPARATFPLGAPSFWVPLAMSQQMRSERQQLSLHAVGRLQTGVSLEQARGEIDGIWNALAKSYPRANANRSMQYCRTARFDRPRLQPPICTSSDGSGWLCAAHRLHEHCDSAICARLWAATGDCRFAQHSEQAAGAS